MYYYKKKDMYIFSPEEKAQAHSISTIDYLSQKYGLTFKTAGRGYRCREHSSLFINADEKAWFWNSCSKGGGDVIEFVRNFDTGLNQRALPLKYDEALKIILQPIATDTTVYKKATTTIPEREALQLPEKKEGRYNRVFAYLIKTRGIDNSIVNTLVNKKYIYEDIRGNVVFVGKDTNKKAVYASIRTTLTDRQFRMEAIGSDKSNGFYLTGFDKSKVYVFEAPIDMLSHATLENLKTNDNKAWLNCSRLSLGGTADNALEHYLKNNKDTKEIILCMDNDKAGKIATDKISEKYTALGYSVTSEPPTLGKDYNEQLNLITQKAVSSVPMLK